MKTKNIFKAVALAMMMPAMLLTTACSNEDVNLTNNDSNNKKGFELPVTINVTRQGDEGTTRATYNATDKKLEFSDGDKLFVVGQNPTSGGAGQFAGTLTWQSGGTFSGTITTQNEYTGSADVLFSAASAVAAVLLPSGYETPGYLFIDKYNGYDDRIGYDRNKGFATTKALAVEQFSYEMTTTYSGGFALHPQNAILNFTITGLVPNAEVNTTLKHEESGIINNLVSGNVTTNGSGEATFAMALSGGLCNIKDLTLIVGGNVVSITSTDKYPAAGKIYNISRSVPAPPAGALSGKFTINGSGNKVMFSQGNLQATTTDLGVNWSWAFAAHQWEYIGAANDKINGNGTVSANGTVDLFGWVGASSTWTGAAMYGISNANSYYQNSVNGYGNVGDENLKSDWGTLAITNGGNRAYSGWYTLNKDEWDYLFSTRTTTSGIRYAKATVNNVKGVILLPDDWSASYHALVSANTAAADFTSNPITAAEWTSDFEAHGAVFLPAAGRREGTAFSSGDPGSMGGYYWSRSSTANSGSDAYHVVFKAGDLIPSSTHSRHYGCSVRLVRDVE